MPDWKNDAELFAMMRKDLYSAVIGDILDQMGYTRQFLPSRLQPLGEEMTLAGRAMPVLEADACPCGPEGTAHSSLLTRPFGLMLEALDDLRGNEVYLCAGASPQYALVGELMCTRMKILGAAGAVVNGFHRDTRGILALEFPCFSYGRYAQDQAPRGRVLDYRVPLEIGGVRVEPGDIVFGDLDGVLAIPRKAEAEVLECARAKAMGEKTVAQAIRSGMSAVESFRVHGIM